MSIILWTFARMEMIVTTMAGLEEVCARELEQAGAQEIEILTRAVSCVADWSVVYRANLWLRTGLRVLLPISRFEISNEQDLYHAIREIDWSEYLKIDRTFAIQANTQSARLNHDRYLALKTKDAIADWFRDKTGKRPSVDTRTPDLLLHLHVDSLNRCTLSLDSSGQSLHRRGYRTSGGEAPLNEVLSAGLVMLSEWKADTPFVDFMCGSGTILIEAAGVAYNLPAGRLRRFGFQRWLNFDKELWHSIQEEAKSLATDFPHPIVGNDRNFRSVRIADQNIEAAGLRGKIKVQRGNFMRFRPPTGPGWAIMNPPYDLRIEDSQIDGLYEKIGDKLKSDFTDYTAWILSGNLPALKKVGLRTSRKIPLLNGKIECKFQRYELYAGSRKQSKNDVEA